jgi:hypothetical protein
MCLCDSPVDDVVEGLFLREFRWLPNHGRPPIGTSPNIDDFRATGVHFFK